MWWATVRGRTLGKTPGSIWTHPVLYQAEWWESSPAVTTAATVQGSSFQQGRSGGSGEGKGVEISG